MVAQGDRCNPQIHRGDPDALLPQGVEPIRGRLVERKNLSGSVMEEQLLEHLVAAKNSRWPACLTDVGMGSQRLFVKTHDRDKKITQRVLLYSRDQAIVLRLAPPLDDDQVIRVQ
jgi:hypothetical protein